MKKRGWIVLTLLVGLAVVPFAVALARPPERTYPFVEVDHPVEMWGDGGDRWAYYSVGEEGTTAALAAKARSELGPQGFVEDKSQKPWYRFVKEDEEVVVCNHSEFEVNGSFNGSKLAKNRFVGRTTNKWPCVLVKNGPGTHQSLALFQIKKLVHGW